MKRYIHSITLCAALLLSACAKEESAQPAPDGVQRLAITIADGGYASENGLRPAASDAPATRAAERGYATEFTAGDACGLYIVRQGTVVAANVKLTAADDAGALVWTADASAGTLYHTPGDRYFLYYPWQAAPEGAPTAGTPADAMDDAAFFADLIDAWRPAADQSDYAKGYTASDLMTAAAEAGTAADGAVPLAFSTTHRMALAVVELPGTVYKFADYPGIDYSTVPKPDFGDAAKPCPIDGFYRYLVHPAAGAELSAAYDDGTEREFTVSIAGNSLAAGSYKTYKVDGGTIVEEYATYAESGLVRIGDFYCTKENGAVGYLIPREADAATVQAAGVVGIVFQTDPSRIGDAEKAALGGTAHGLVMAVKNAATS